MASSKLLPFRQDDPSWANDVMWDRERVIEAHMSGNNASRADAEDLLRKFESSKNTVGKEGCLLTCLAMALRLLDAPSRRRSWTPKKLNFEAQRALYYTPAGVSMAPLYADLICEASAGEVQLCAKEEYLSGEKGWPRTFASESWLVRGYRRLSIRDRRDFVVMLKTGTYDDTVASHYVLIHPARPGDVDEDDAEILDPAMPSRARAPWRLSDSAKRICGDRAIRREWSVGRIDALQLAGVWIFGRWRASSDKMLMQPLIAAWAAEGAT